MYLYSSGFSGVKRVQFKSGSRKEDYVDKSGDMDTLFEKARYLIDRLPAYLLPLRHSYRFQLSSLRTFTIYEEIRDLS